MSYPYLFNRAYGLCSKFNKEEIADDLAYMTESELIGVINYLMQFQRGQKRG